MIVNCTNHIATKEQLEMGIVEPKNKEKIQELAGGVRQAKRNNS